MYVFNFLILIMLTIQTMLESGVHFGHHVQRWNPKMAPYIYCANNKMHIIDIVKTRTYLTKICQFLIQTTDQTTEFLFVGTKLQAASEIKARALDCSAHYVNHRWLGGMLTNWNTMKTCIQKLRDLEFQEESGVFEQLPKKEVAILRKRKERLEKNFAGIKDMKGLPDYVIIVGQPTETNAVKECLDLQIKTITILDTNCDPSLTNFFIPGNDDSMKSISLILGELSDAIKQARNKA